MNIPDALGLLPSREAETEEYKQSWQDKECTQALAAFANTRGGTLWVGVRDSGHAIGWAGDGKEMERISNYITTKLGVHPQSITIEILEAQPVLAIQMASARTPVAYDGHYYRRVGNSTREVPESERPLFLLERIGQSWDALPSEVPLAEYSQKALDTFLSLARTRLPEAATAESTELLVQKLNLLHTSGNLKRAGVVLLTDEPPRWFPQARIQAARFDVDETTLSDDQRFNGSFVEQLEGVLGWIKGRINITFQIREGAPGEDIGAGVTSLQRGEIWEIPLVALREALLNALIHRDYTAMGAVQVRLYPDRLLILNPGGLSAGITVAELRRPHQSSPRNPLLADMAYKMGLIESWGTGTLRMAEACRKQGLPPPEFTDSPAGFTVTLHRRAFTAESLRQRGFLERQIEAIEFVRKEGAITNKQYRDLAGVSDEIARQELNALVEGRLLKRVGAGRSVRYILV